MLEVLITKKNKHNMKKFNSFEEALAWQKGLAKDAYRSVNESLETGHDVIDRVQFSIGEILWVILAENFSLDDYEEWVTQYGVDSSGNWYAVSGGHCSCYGWEEMKDGDETKYESLELLLKSDPSAEVISKFKDALKDVFGFLQID